MRTKNQKSVAHRYVASENEKINNIGSKSDRWGGFIKFGKKNYFPN